MAHALQGLRIIPVTVFPAIEGQFLEQRPVITPATGKGLLILDRLEIEIDVALINDAPNVLQQLRKIGKLLHKLRLGEKGLVARGQHRSGQLAQQDVVVDGPQMAVERVVVGPGKGDCPPRQHLPVVRPGMEIAEAVQVRLPDTQEFILAQLLQLPAPERKYKPDIGKKRGHARKRLLRDEMLAQEIVELEKTLIVTGNPHIQQHLVIPELNPRQWLDLVPPAFQHKVKNPGGVVDVGKRQGPDPHCCSFLHQPLQGKRPVPQTEITVAIQIHI